MLTFDNFENFDLLYARNDENANLFFQLKED